MLPHDSLFVADDAALTQGFPGWKRPLLEPAHTTTRNPLTGERIECLTWDPDPTQPSTHDGSVRSWDLHDTPGSGPARYEEASAHPLVRSSPHRCFRGHLLFTLVGLCALLTARDIEDAFRLFRPARIAPPGALDIYVVPDEIVTALSSLSPEQIVPLARAWAEPSDELDEVGATARIEALRELGTIATTRGGRVYVMSGG
jgi:hypothetical protein